jgi:SecD/SecF fusion protein
MQLKGLVRFFAIALILISLYQLSFTWFVGRHEKKMAAKATQYMKSFPAPDQKYPGNVDSQAIYKESLEMIEKGRLRRLLDSTKESKVTWWGTTYQKAKEQELNLGLDLQGGMNVTLEVGLDGLIKALSNNPRDPNLIKALQQATQNKVNSNADYITLFSEAYKNVTNGGKLSSIFANPSRNAIKIDASDATVLAYIRDQANGAINNTYQVLTKRIDQFGVAQPNINLDQNKGIITVELAGVQDPERVRKFLQATARLQFWEVYDNKAIGSFVDQADKALEDYLNGVKADTGKTNNPATAQANPNDTTQLTAEQRLLDTAGNKQTTTAGTPGKISKPLAAILQGATSPSAMASIALKDTGTFNSYMALDAFITKFPPDAKFLYGFASDKGKKIKDRLDIYVIKTVPGSDRAKLEGDHVSNAFQDFDQFNNEVTVNMGMDKQGTKIWADMTSANVGKPIAISLDNFVYSAPNVNEAITGGDSRINGNFTIEEGQDLANILKSGKLDAPANIVQEQVVGPTLGKNAVRGGSLSFIISFVVIFLLMLLYYNTSGWVANIALIFNLLFTIGVLSALNATLTAAGIAGLVLTIGMAVDTNVIIFERIKEELTWGKNYQQAVAEGYRRSLPPVLDAHFTTFLTALILFIFGLGPVRGFATTQMLGISLSLFCGILFSRLITDWWTKKNRHFEYFTGLSRKIFKHANFKFIEYRKVAYGISVVVLVLGISSFFYGFDQGVEFKGGRSYTVRFAKPIEDLDKVRDALKASFGENPVIKTVGGNKQLNITTSYLKGQDRADSLVQTKLYEGLKSFLPQGVGYAEFMKDYKMGSQTVQPTISDDLKKGAWIATIVSIICIFLYIFIRFRDWRYSAGTIVALLHDVFVTLAVFSFFRHIMPFPLEIDQHFIAAVLTVIGFSMNDTVIVFDRIREYSRKMRGSDKRTIINRAINDTLSRTIMTSLTVFLTILILFIYGGEVTRGFAFAMLIGVITGTYSSIFVAAPILVDIAKDKPLGEADATHSTDAKAKAKPAAAK